MDRWCTLDDIAQAAIFFASDRATLITGQVMDTAILSVLGEIIGVREASEFSTGKAIGTGIVGFIAQLIVWGIIFAIVRAIF